MTLQQEILALGQNARWAAHSLAQLSSEQKRAILVAMAEELQRRRGWIQAANAEDVEAARKSALSAALVDRLTLTDVRIDSMIRGIEEVAALPDPVGDTLETRTRPNGLEIRKIRVPIGVIGIIYESRPNVTADAAALCIKSSNAVILRGGSESIRSNKAIAEALQAGGKVSGLPEGAVQLVATTDRGAVRELVQLDAYVDVIIPRGGEGLIGTVVDMARVPVIKHYKGVCHVYVDESADLEKALAICENAKCQRPGVCNAMETLLVHEKMAPVFLPAMAQRLMAAGVELRGDDRARALVPEMAPANEDDWYAEYLDLILAVRVVPDVASAVQHINTYGSHHSDAIVAEAEAAQERFTREVDSAAVYVNASTRFTDGGEFGLGTEMGISTDKLHARGPMGLAELTTYKYVVVGNGQIRG